MRVARKYTQAAHRVLSDHIYHRALGHRRPVIQRQPVGVRSVALTFDDGPSPETTASVLHALASANAHATFFLSGVRAEAWPTLVADIIARGHAVYGHGWDHVNLEQHGADAALAAARKVEALLSRFRPTPSPYLLRFPYNAGHQRGWMHHAMRAFHPDVRFASWSHNTRDWTLADGCQDLDAVTRNCARAADVIGAMRDLPGSIILMHENPFGAEGPLAPAVAGLLLPRVLAHIKARGLTCDLIDNGPTRNVS